MDSQVAARLLHNKKPNKQQAEKEPASASAPRALPCGSECRVVAGPVKDERGFSGQLVGADFLSIATYANAVAAESGSR